jgi:hypothetical protein
MNEAIKKDRNAPPFSEAVRTKVETMMLVCH